MKRGIVAGIVLAASAVAVPAGTGNAEPALSPGCQRLADWGDFLIGGTVYSTFYDGEVMTLTVGDAGPFTWDLQIFDAGSSSVPIAGGTEPGGTRIVQTYAFDGTETGTEFVGHRTDPFGIPDVALVTCSAGQPDSDGDGVLDADDLCPGTTADPAPSGLKAKRNWPNATETFGCSPSQIIDDAGLGKGHRKHGISRGALADWIAAVS